MEGRARLKRQKPAFFSPNVQEVVTERGKCFLNGRKEWKKWGEGSERQIKSEKGGTN